MKAILCSVCSNIYSNSKFSYEIFGFLYTYAAMYTDVLNPNDIRKLLSNIRSADSTKIV